MPTPPVVIAEHLSKNYILGSGIHASGTLRDALSNGAERAFAAATRRERRQRHPRETLHALRDVSFEIGQGEVVGVIGRNGAGKSTLLKILSRITEPSSGRARLRGRVGSLLEVGTGFHGELSGRENVYLNGAILGMKRADIDKRFDDIVEFAEMERFLDTPVKRYSSGMTVRLAFAVAAHLEPEILLVDEVLAVGDVSFQRKCIGKMSEVAGEGRTVLFVSHNMAIMQALCSRGILLEHGRVSLDGTISDAVSAYLRGVEEAATLNLLDRKDRRGWGEVRLAELKIEGDGGELLATGRPARFTLATKPIYDENVRRLACTISIVNNFGQVVSTLTTDDAAPLDATDPEHPFRYVCEIDALTLVPGRYRLDVELRGHADIQDAIEGAALFDVEQGTLGGRPVAGGRMGDITIQHRWTVPSLD